MPSNCRTLLRTPTCTATRACGEGSYFHYGIEKGIINAIQCGTRINNDIHINVNIDGLPLAKSSHSQLWPILEQIVNSDSQPFLIRAYHGNKKPEDVQDFLRDFRIDYLNQHIKGSIMKNKKYYVKLRAIICDNPARCFVTGTKGNILDVLRYPSFMAK